MKRFCFRLISGAGLAAALFAAGLPDAGSSPPRRVTSVVRPDSRTGKLVRSVIVTPKPEAAERAAGPAIDAAVEQAASEQAVSPDLIHSVIKVESNYNRYAVSPKGALGLMQLMPSTARRFGVADVFNPVENIQGGAKYLKYLLDLYHDDYPLALAAYNAGEQAVAKYGAVPPYPETRNYVAQVNKRLAAAPNRAQGEPRTGAPPAAAPEAGPAHMREIVEADGSVRYVLQ